MELDELWRAYPELEKINEKYNGMIESNIQFKQFSYGDYIKSIQTQCSELLFIIKGYMKIEKIDASGKLMNLYELGPGELCHEMVSCYLKCEPLNLAGRAVTDMEAAFLPMHIVDQYIMSDSSFLKFMYSNLYSKFKNTVLSKEEIIHESVMNRIIQYLKNKNSSVIYITHQEIADDLGTAREVVSKRLKVLEKSGAVELERNKIKIIDLNVVEQ